ncbi:hypothetical protein H8959_016048 [Pygathrix nigripes]
MREPGCRVYGTVSKADCYVQLWLPTASPSPAQTRAVANCSDPEWNETFHYQIHGAVKNALELTLYDNDILDSDQLSLLLFDLRSLKCGQPHRHTFPLNHQDSQELQVEFALEKSQVPASEIITNGVLVITARSLSRTTHRGCEQGSLPLQGPFSQAVLDIFTSRLTSAQSFNFTRGLCLHKDYVAGREFVAWKDRHPDAFPNQLTPMRDCLYLVDGGFAINSPFPLALRPQRAVDLILSFDYSLEAPFEVLKMTEKYCLDRGIPFPSIQVGPEDKEEARECCLFAKTEDPRCPIVLHFPLVNHTFRTHLAPGVERQTAEEKAFGDFVINRPDTPYGMMNFTYEPQDFDRLVALSRYNVLNNVETLKHALQLALDRHQARERTGG